MCVAVCLEQVQAKGQMQSVICVRWICVLMFPAQSLHYMSTLAVLNPVFHLYVFVSYLVSYSAYKHLVLAHWLVWGPEIAVPLILSRQRGERESEMGKATWRGRNRLLKTGVRCCKAWQKALLHTKSSASFFQFRRSLQRSRRPKSSFAYTIGLAVLSSASHVSKVSRKWIDVSRQPVLETHTHPFCFISCLSPQFHY